MGKRRGGRDKGRREGKAKGRERKRGEERKERGYCLSRTKYKAERKKRIKDQWELNWDMRISENVE